MFCFNNKHILSLYKNIVRGIVNACLNNPVISLSHDDEYPLFLGGI
jgi:hypothetical protein